MASISPVKVDADALIYDVVVVGSGPAALPLVAKLKRQNRSICIIESGLEKPDDAIQELNQLDNIGHSIRQQHISRLRALGGTSNLWPGRCMLLEPMDFEKRPWIKDSGWPIEYSEYVRYLGPAAEILGIPAQHFSDQVDDSGLIREGLQGSSFDSPEFSLKLALWGKSPFRAWKHYRSSLEKSHGIDVHSGATLTNLRFDDSGQCLEGIVATTMEGERRTIRGRHYVLAMGGIENARMLLVAARQNPHATFPKAALGRYYMDHPRAVAGRIRLNRQVNMAEYLGVPVSRGIMQAGLGLSKAAQVSFELLNSYIYFEAAHSPMVEAGYNSGVQFMKRVTTKGHIESHTAFNQRTKVKDLIYQLTPREILPHDLYRAYCYFRNRIKSHTRDLVLINHCEQAPSPNSRITLGEELDRFGNPLPRLDWKLGDKDIETIVFLQKQIKHWLEHTQLGVMTTSPDDIKENAFLDASHHMGTTRMGSDPQNSVVDSDLKLHGSRNVYLSGSSVFPTGGSANPTWSIVALALRLGEHLSRQLELQR